MQNFENLVEAQVDSREIFDGHIMHVFKDTVRLPNGADASREYMRHVGAVCVVPLLDDGSVLLERQFRYPVGQVLIEIPAGKLDSKAEDPQAAAKRELLEETGAVAGSSSSSVCFSRPAPTVTKPFTCTPQRTSPSASKSWTRMSF